ncbi:SAV_915 family protein [Streptomyces sp. NPDC087908]|uniref:SAV_915 family protein n=1 Tax=Streptomyces sp. NPDC087908 TaxID=3365820 RepID=UPI0037F34D0F
MADGLYGDDPEPGEPFPAGRLCVPVRPGAHGCVTRLFRTPVGGRTAVAFTDPARLRAVLGADQPWIRLAEPALRALVAPLDVRDLRIDPLLTAPRAAATAVALPQPQRQPHPQPLPLTALAS